MDGVAGKGRDCEGPGTARRLGHPGAGGPSERAAAGRAALAG